MVQKVLISLVFFVLAGLSRYAESRFSYPQIDQITQSALSIGILYFVFSVLLINLASRQIQDAKTAYRYRKSVGTIFYLILLLVLFRIWIEDPQALLVSYGIVAAGATIALQDLIKNIAGGIVVMVNSFFRVGDRIEVNDSLGDVIDVGVFNTTMFEIRNWVNGDQATGRIVTIPNGVFLSQKIMNYTGDHEYIWDEIVVPVTYKSNWQKAEQLFREIAEGQTKDFVEPAKKQLNRLSRIYYVAERQAEPSSYITSNDNWIDIHIRYITAAKSRRETKSEIYKAILKSIARYKSIQIASTTLDIIGFPGKK